MIKIRQLVLLAFIFLPFLGMSQENEFTQDSFHCGDFVVALSDLSEIDREYMVGLVTEIQDELIRKYPNEKFPYFPFEYSKGYQAVSEHKAYNDSSVNHWYLVQVSIDKNLNRTFTYHFHKSTSKLHWKNSRRYNLEVGYNTEYSPFDLSKNSVISPRSFQFQTLYIGFRYKILENYWLGIAYRRGHLNDNKNSLLSGEHGMEGYASGSLLFMRELIYDKTELFPYIGIYSIDGDGTSFSFPTYYQNPAAYFYGRGGTVGININYRINRFFSIGTSVSSFIGSRDDHVWDQDYPNPSVTHSPKFDAMFFNSFNISFTR